MSLWGLLTGLRSKFAILTGLGSGLAGGVFKSYLPVYLGGRFGSAHFGVSRFRSVDAYAWQQVPLMVCINSGWYLAPLYRWDVLSNAWLPVEVIPQGVGRYGRWNINLWGECEWL